MTSPVGREPAAVNLGALVADSVPARVRRRAAEALVDALGLWIATRNRAEVRRVRAALAAAGPGGPRPVESAFCWAVGIHTLGLDDFHPPTSVHPMAPVVAGALAAARWGGASGRSLLEAISIGYQAACSLGRAVRRGVLHRRGFHPTAVLGTVGAALASSRAMNLGPDHAAHAVAIAAARAAGLAHFDPEAAVKALQVGWSAATGVQAAFLAAEGYPGAMDVFEAPRGFFAAMVGDEGYDPAPLATPLTGPPAWSILEVSQKPYAVSTDLQTVVEALSGVLRDERIISEDVATVEVALPPPVYRTTAEPEETRRHPATVREAQRSIYHAAAIILSAPPATAEDPLHGRYVGGWLDHPALAAWAARVTARPDPSLESDNPYVIPAEVTVTTRTGERHVRVVREHRGSPHRPFTPMEQERRLAYLLHDESLARTLLDVTLRLDDAPTLGELFAFLDAIPPDGSSDADVERVDAGA